MGGDSMKLDTEWSRRIAVLCADALVDGKIIERGALKKAAEIIEEEIAARMAVNDYPRVAR
jgi:hypothetical protein